MSPDKEDGEPGPTAKPTPELPQGEVLNQKDKDLPPDPPDAGEEEGDSDEEEHLPEDPEKQPPPPESEEDSEDEKENTAQSGPDKGKKAEVEDEKGEDMEDVAL